MTTPKAPASMSDTRPNATVARTRKGTEVRWDRSRPSPSEPACSITRSVYAYGRSKCTRILWMVTSGTKKTRALNRGLIEDATLALVDTEGVGSLSLRRLAGALGVTPMALYHHVKGKDDLLAVVADVRLSEAGLPSSTGDWRQYLIEMATSLRQVLRSEPDLLELFTRRPVTTPAARARVAAALGVLHHAGFDDETSTDVYAAAHTYAIGFCALESARERGGPPTTDESDPVTDAIRGFVTERRFLIGLNAMLTGFGPAR